MDTPWMSARADDSENELKMALARGWVSSNLCLGNSCLDFVMVEQHLLISPDKISKFYSTYETSAKQITPSLPLLTQTVNREWLKVREDCMQRNTLTINWGLKGNTLLQILIDEI